MDPLFLESFLNVEHRVLGRVLRPLCLWHHLNLDLAQSPFVGYDSPKDSRALILAVRICRARPDSTFQMLPQKKTPTHLFFRSLSHHTELFECYVRDFFAPPRFFKKSGSKSPAAPWPLYVVSRLMRYGNFSADQAWTLPIGQALWFSAALGEAGGEESALVSAADLKAMREAGYDV